MAKTITASVGLNGLNRIEDVKTIRTLLNQVPLKDGGPVIKLVADGISGQTTRPAIQASSASAP